MLLSMTGYGRAVKSFKEKTITVEVRSLNSKFTDLRFKIPQNYREKEPVMRRMVTDSTQRGKIDVSVDVKSLSGEAEFALNKSLFKKYHEVLSTLSNEIGMNNEGMMQAILRMPNVVAAADNELEEEEWTVLNATISEALEAFSNFRKTEGNAMEVDCTSRINTITTLLEQISPFESERVNRLKKKINKHMEEYVGKDNIDANRFEQEILYYLEKIDVTEEKVRLAQHCKYFIEELQASKTLKGRKLSFISQEIGREINTLGSKANSSDIQHIVVQMKDELEKIKEQVANTV